MIKIIGFPNDKTTLKSQKFCELFKIPHQTYIVGKDVTLGEALLFITFSGLKPCRNRFPLIIMDNKVLGTYSDLIDQFRKDIVFGN